MKYAYTLLIALILPFVPVYMPDEAAHAHNEPNITGVWRTEGFDPSFGFDRDIHAALYVREIGYAGRGSMNLFVSYNTTAGPMTNSWFFTYIIGDDGGHQIVLTPATGTAQISFLDNGDMQLDMQRPWGRETRYSSFVFYHAYEESFHLAGRSRTIWK